MKPFVYFFIGSFFFSPAISLAAGTSGQCHVLAFNPNAAETSATDVVVEISEPQSLAYAQV